MRISFFTPLSEAWSSPVQLSPQGQNCILSSFALNEKREGAILWIAQSSPDDLVIQLASLFLD